MFQITPMVKRILILNIGIWLLMIVSGLPLIQYFGLRVAFSEEFQPWQLFTYMWLHDDVGFGHVFWNMILVLICGIRLEGVWGSKKFLIYYLACGIGAGVLYAGLDYMEKSKMRTQYEVFMADPNPDDFQVYLMEYAGKSNALQHYRFTEEYFENEDNISYERQAREIVSSINKAILNIPMVGASGAIYGLMVAMILLFPNMELLLMFVFPVKIKYLFGAAIVMEVFYEMNRVEGDTIAHLAHLSGALVGFIMIRYLWAEKSRF